MASNRFKLIYSSSDDTKPTQNTPLEELKEKGVPAIPEEDPVKVPKYCSHCGKQGEIYNGVIPVRGLKPYTWLLCVLAIVLIWAYVWWYAQNDGATSSWIINIGLIVSPIALSLCALLVMKKLASPHPGQAVICHDCHAAFPLSEAPKFTQGWDMNKFVLVLQGQDKKSRRRKAMAEKLAKKAGMSVTDMQSTLQRTTQDAPAVNASSSSVSTLEQQTQAACTSEARPDEARKVVSTTAVSDTEEFREGFTQEAPQELPQEAAQRELTPEEIGIAAAREAQKPNKNSMLGRLF